MDELLKTGHARTVFLRGNTVVKRFRHPSPAARLLDGRRARREHRLLQCAHDAGVPVPRPLGLERTSEGWEVSMEHVPGEPLELLLETEAGRGRIDRPLAHALGELLAAIGRLGLDHADLHPGNVLVDEHGAVTLIDLHKARLRRPDPRCHGRDLLALYAHLRETVAPGVRMALVQGWAEGLGYSPDTIASRVVELEREAPRLRRRRVEASLARWTRPSGRLVADRLGDDEVLRRHDVAPEDLRDSSERLTVTGKPETVRREWLAAARAFEHRLPGARPSVLEVHARWAWFELPPGSQPIGDDGPDPLEGMLIDRGLRDSEVPSSRIALPDGTAGLAPPRTAVGSVP